MMGKKRLIGVILLVSISIFASGCALLKKDKDKGVTPTLKTIHITQLTQQEEVLFPGETQKFAAKGLDQNGKEMTGLTFTWSVEKPDDVNEADVSLDAIEQGRIVAFSANKPGEYRLVCEAKGVTGRLNVNVESPKLTTIEVDPDAAVVRPDESLYLTARGLNQKGEPMEGIDFGWWVDPEAGRIEKEGEYNALFIAEKNSGEYEIVCSATGIEGVERRIPIIVGAPEVTTIEVEPSSVVLAPGKKCQFTAYALDQAGDYMFDAEFTWSVDDEQAGTITSGGCFTAGDQVGEYKVICQATNGVKVEIPIRIAVANDQLHTIGKQLVGDSQAAWDRFINSPRLATILENQALPAVQNVSTIIETVFSQVIQPVIFFYEPDTYEDLDDLWNAEKYEEMQEGTWKFAEAAVYEYDEEIGYIDQIGVATVEITRNADGTNSNLTYILDLKYDDSDDVDHYEGQIIVSDSALEQPEDGKSYDINFDFGIEFALANSAEGSLAGKVDLNLTAHAVEIEPDDWETLTVLNRMTGSSNGSFTYNNGEYAFDGDVSLLFASDQEDFFRGTINLPDAKLEGEIALSYVSNPWLKDQPLVEIVNCRLVPQKLTLNGSLVDQSQESKLSAEGTFALELKNAAQFDFSDRYSEMNWPGIKLNFEGILVSQDNNRLAGTLSFEEVDWNRLDVKIGYDLTLDEETRRINLTAKSSDKSKMDIKITSDWGQAVIDMHLEFKPQLFYYNEYKEFVMGRPSLSGQVSVEGKKVGVLSLSDWGLRVDYDDGTFETF